MNDELKEVSLSRQELEDMIRSTKLALVATAQQDMVDYEFVMRCAYNHNRFTRLLEILESQKHAKQ